MLQYNDTKQFIGDYRQYLKDNGITNTHVARKIDISPQQLQNIYRKQELTVADLVKLCNAINMQCNITIERRDYK